MTPNSSSTVNLIHDSISSKTEISRREADVKGVTLISDNFGEVHPLFRPFCQTGFVVDSFGSRHSICVLRDTAALQTLVKRSSLPPTAYKALPEVRLIRGIGDQEVEISMIEFDVELKEFSGRIRAGVVDSLPVGVDFLLANDIYCKFCEIPEVSAVTRSMTKNKESLESSSTHDFNIDNLFRSHDNVDSTINANTSHINKAYVGESSQDNTNKALAESSCSSNGTNQAKEIPLNITREKLIDLQKADNKIARLISQVVTKPYSNS